MSRRVPVFTPRMGTPLPDALQGPVVLDIHITVDGKGLMKTNVSGNPMPNVIQVITVLTDALKGYMDTVNRQNSMLIDPKKPEIVRPNGEEHGREKTQDDDNS